MTDFGQYTAEQAYGRLKHACRYDGKTRVCERCGNSTRAGLIFGMVICTPCWKKQIGRK